MNFKKLMLLVLVTLVFNSCQKSSKNASINELELDTDVIAENLSSLIQKSDSSYIIKNRIEFSETLCVLYKDREYAPFFLESDGTGPLNSLVEYLRFAYRHGINPKRYNTDGLTVLLKKLNDTANHKIDYNLAAELDYLAADAFLRYQSDIMYGIVKPASLDSENYDIPLPVRRTDPFVNLLDENRIETLEAIQPKNKRYIYLQSALEKETEKAGTLKLKKISFSEKKIEFGKHSGTLPQIAHNLFELGLLDTTYKPAIKTLYDTTLFLAVKNFQKQYGLIDDGVIGKNTIDQLNLTPEARIEIIKINLERLRWTSYTDSAKYVLVNIPDFYVYGFSGGQQKVKIKVCTGQKRERYYEQRKKLYERTKNWLHRPKNFETPQVYSRIDMIITNPQWSVPQSIAKNETYYEIMKDSTYLRRLGFKVYKGTEQIDHTTIDWKKFSPNNLPFNFVQDPGGANALGRLKFMFNNKFAIYLHDTPTRPPFSTLPRAVSHGCIRVEKPLQLAEFILEDEPKLTLDEIKVEIGVKPEDTELLDKYYSAARRKANTKLNLLSKPVPVFVDYFTAWVDADGILQFRPDVYEKDKILIAALKSEKAL